MGKTRTPAWSHVNGTLYGTTAYGGSSGLGTVYSIDLDGTEKVLYSFAGGSDGDHPSADLIEVNGTLYGTTVYGGTSNHGTVFSKSTPAAPRKVLHSFAKAAPTGLPRRSVAPRERLAVRHDGIRRHIRRWNRVPHYRERRRGGFCAVSPEAPTEPNHMRP